MTDQVWQAAGPEARSLAELVERTRRLLRLSSVASGAGLTIGLLGGGLVLAAGVDLLVPLPTGLRLAAFVLIALLAGVALVLGMARPLVRRLSPRAVARRIESHLPRIQNRLVSCLDLLANTREREHSPAFYQRLLNETHDRVCNFAPKTVIDQARLRQAGLLAAGSVAAFLLLALAIPERFPTAVRRICLPLADIPPVAGVSYRVGPGNAKLLRGDDLLLTARVTRGHPAGLKLAVWRDSGGRPLWYEMQPQPQGRWQFLLTGFEHSFTYRVWGGGTWSQQYHVGLLERPTIVELHTLVHYPAYLGQAEPLVGPSQQTDVTGPEGSEVEVVATVKGSVAKGSIQRLELTTNAVSAAATDAGPESQVRATLPMRRQNDGRWSGRFLLTSNGYYRIEFTDELGHANKRIQPARFVAVADQPPQVSFERPGTDLVLSEGSKVPLVIAASDDYGLAEVAVVVQREGTNQVTVLPVKQYARPQPSDALMTTLDLAALKLKVGEAIRYQAQARDRKGQWAKTKDFVVRIAPTDQAADQRWKKFAAAQDALGQNLSRLMTAQERVRSKLGELAVKYAPLEEKLEAARLAVRPLPGFLPAGTELIAATNSPAQAPVPTLDPATAGLLVDLRQRLGELATWQQQNAEQAGQFLAAWGQVAGEAAALPTLPPQMADQLRLLQQSFQDIPVALMQNLMAALQQGANPQLSPPELAQLRRLSERLQQALATMASQWQDLDGTADLLRDDPDRAAGELENDRLRAQGELAVYQLENLQDQLGTLHDEMKRLEGNERHLMAATSVAAETNLPPLFAQQTNLEASVDSLLDFTRALQAADRVRPLRRPPSFPAAMYAPDQGDSEAPPAEEDTPDPSLAGTNSPPSGTTPAATDRAATEAEDENFLPGLGGPAPKLDPRYARELRPVEPAPAAADRALASRRGELAAREWRRLKELNLARQSVATDQQSVGGLVEQLRQAVAGARAADAQQAQRFRDQLAQALQAQALQQAMAMAGRMPQMPGAAFLGTSRRGWGPLFPTFSMYGGGAGGLYYPVLNGKTPELDVTARTVILGLQPQLREELLQGMQETGPAAYQPFIENYFRQLTKVKPRP